LFGGELETAAERILAGHGQMMSDGGSAIIQLEDGRDFVNQAHLQSVGGGEDAVIGCGI